MGTETIFKVEDVKEFRRGETNGRAWVIYHVLTVTPAGEKGLTFSTLDPEWVRQVGSTIRASYEVRENKGFKNFQLCDLADATVLATASPKTVGTDPVSPTPTEPTRVAIGFTERDRELLATVHALVRELREKFR